MKLIGLTGGIGMGKSTAARILARHGLPVADTDAIAHDLVTPGQPALEEIQSQFGAACCGPDGHLLRDRLAQIVFSDDSARRRLEAILHPRIRKHWKEQVDQWRVAGRSLAVVMIPLLFETNARPEFDAVICVACSSATQWNRLRDRGWTDYQIQLRLQAQLPVRTKIERADYLVWNDANLDLLEAQLLLVLQAAVQ
jgi:dephospho-CoA kinase